MSWFALFEAYLVALALVTAGSIIYLIRLI